MLQNRYLDIELECGIDESGAGPAFGPVVAACVIMPKNWNHPILNDSKKLSEKKRIFLYDEIVRDCVEYSISEVPSDKIDEINILQARFLAMDMCVKKLKNIPKHLIIDGNRFYNIYNIPYTCIVKGDGLYTSIAAASVLAKVYRDRLIESLSNKIEI